MLGVVTLVYSNFKLPLAFEIFNVSVIGKVVVGSSTDATKGFVYIVNSSQVPKVKVVTPPTVVLP